MELDADRCYQAILSRDQRYDGKFFTAVLTTGVYCRPICPAGPPLAKNVTFYSCASAAEEAGFRPCRRCRPETAPGTPAWAGTSASVSRALRLISEGVLDDGSVTDLARKLGVGDRHLRRLFRQHLGTSPLAVAQTRRLHFAHNLLKETDLAVTEIAYCSGFASLRRFNSAFRNAFKRSPSESRNPSTIKAKKTRQAPDGFTLKLAYRSPFNWDAILSFLGPRAIPGVESVDHGVYRRTIELGEKPSLLEVAHVPEENRIELQVERHAIKDLLRIAEKIRSLFDLNADPQLIAADLGKDPTMKSILDRVPGLRLPGAWDGFEIAVRAILGQQVTVGGATTISGRLVTRFGQPLKEKWIASGGFGLTHLFPSARVLAQASLDDIASIGIPKPRARALQALARSVSEDKVLEDRSGGLEGPIQRLTKLPGIGDWTAQYIAMRALGEPDAFPSTDLVLKKILEAHEAPPSIPGKNKTRRPDERWSPWRAYAAMALWYDHGNPQHPSNSTQAKVKP